MISILFPHFRLSQLSLNFVSISVVFLLELAISSAIRRNQAEVKYSCSHNLEEAQPLEESELKNWLLFGLFLIFVLCRLKTGKHNENSLSKHKAVSNQNGISQTGCTECFVFIFKPNLSKK